MGMVAYMGRNLSRRSLNYVPCVICVRRGETVAHKVLASKTQENLPGRPTGNAETWVSNNFENQYIKPCRITYGALSAALAQAGAVGDNMVIIAGDCKV